MPDHTKLPINRSIRRSINNSISEQIKPTTMRILGSYFYLLRRQEAAKFIFKIMKGFGSQVINGFSLHGINAKTIESRAPSRGIGIRSDQHHPLKQLTAFSPSSATIPVGFLYPQCFLERNQDFRKRTVFVPILCLHD